MLLLGDEQTLSVVVVVVSGVVVVGTKETTLSHGSEQYAYKPPLNVTERSREAHARLCVLEQVSGESDGGVPEVAEEATEAIDQRVTP